jgi:Flp pilus assembly protein TadG
LNRKSTYRIPLYSRPLPPTLRCLLGEAGGTLLETAFSLLILLTVIFGIAEVSLALYSYHYVSNAAREGARYAIVRGSTWETAPWNSNGEGGACATDTNPGGCTASTAQIASYVSKLGFPGINITAGDVCVEYFTSVPTSPATTCSANSSPNGYGNVVLVKVTYNFNFGLPFMHGANSFTYPLTSTAQMVIAQ